MSDKLFYNVPKEKAGSFKSTVSNAIGFVAQTDTEGYMIANGKEFGKMRVSSEGDENKIVVNGTTYIFLVNDRGELSIQPDVPVTFTSFSVNPTSLATSGNSITRETDYVGKSYTGATIQKLVNNANITLTASVSNPQDKQFTYYFKNESGTVIHEGTATGTTVTYTVNQRDYFNDGTSVTVADGTFTWAKRTASSTISCKSNKDIDGNGPDKVTNEVFTCKINNDSKTAMVTGGQSCSFTATPKVPIMYGTNGTGAGCTTLLQDYTYGGTMSLDKNLTFNAGNIPVFAVPTCLGKELKCFNETGALEDTSLKKSTTTTLTLNGCTTEYDIYIYAGGAWGGSATIKVKFK